MSTAAPVGNWSVEEGIPLKQKCLIVRAGVEFIHFVLILCGIINEKDG